VETPGIEPGCLHLQTSSTTRLLTFNFGLTSKVTKNIKPRLAYWPP